jgi:acetyl esterase/lipase
MRHLLLALVGLLLGACSPLSAVNVLVPERGFDRIEGVAYGDDPRHRLDIYMPKAPGGAALPVVVFFYGGAWQGGKRGEHLFMGEALASRGFVVVIPDYRVYPQARYPAFVEDGARAVAWVAKHIGEHRGDARHVVLMGHSAGAHIAAMLVYNRRFLDPAARTAVRGFVGLAGPYDFKPLDPVTTRILGSDGGADAAMPAHWVRGGEPPSLLLTGDKDTRVDPGNTDRLARRLRAAGSPVEVRHYPGLSHSSMLLNFAAPFRDDALLDSIADFVRKVRPS